MEILGTTAAAGSNAASSQTRLAGDYDSFLQLLTTQLKNQDPLSPLDATQFVSQLSQFAMVEQAIMSNKNLEALLQSSRNAVMSSDIGLIGRQVEVPGKALDLGSSGQAAFTYKLGKDAETAAVNIRDAGGNLVRTIALDPRAGEYSVTWDGKDDAGNAVPAGDYKLDYAVFDMDGKPQSVTSFVAARVDRIELDASGSTLVLSNGERITSGNVRAILNG
jgi:flagellar basal-body rod modification protein FlgD